MDLSAVADASARVSEICQRAASPWSFASVLNQVSQGAPRTLSSRRPIPQ
jgi:hypothetical protein